MDIVDPVDCTLIARRNFYLGVLFNPFPLLLFLVEREKLFAKLISLLFLFCSFSFLFSIEFFVYLCDVFIIFFCCFILFLKDDLVIFDNLIISIFETLFNLCFSFMIDRLQLPKIVILVFRLTLQLWEPKYQTTLKPKYQTNIHT